MCLVKIWQSLELMEIDVVCDCDSVLAIEMPDGAYHHHLTTSSRTANHEQSFGSRSSIVE